MLLLLGCWQPGEYLPPVPENLARVAGPKPEVGQAAAEDAPPDAPDAPDAQAEAAPEAPEAPEAPAPPAAPPIEAYAAHTVGAPLTLVDDRGQIVSVLSIPQMEVLVLAEEPPVRKKVRCTACTPEVEGWLQYQNVERK